MLFLRLISFAGTGLMLWACVALAAEPAKAERQETLVLGRISSKPHEQYAKLDALNSYVVGRLQGSRIKAGEVVIARDINHMVQLLKEGAVDYFSETAYTAIRLEKMGLARVALNEWKNGAHSYSSIILARQDGISSLDELQGKKIVFEDPGSTSGFFLAYAYLSDKGYNLRGAGKPHENDNPTDIKYEFAGDETTIMGRIIRRRADAGVIDSSEWQSEDKIPPSFRSALKVIAQTPPIVRSLLLTRSDLDPELQQKLTDILISLGGSDEATKVMEQYFSVTRFERISRKDRGQLQELRKSVDRYFPSAP